MKVALIGTGSMARIYGKLLCEREGIQFCGVVGNSAESTGTIAAELAVAAYPGGDIARLHQENGPIDAYLVATPEWVRVQVLKDIIPTGAHILIEKPLATSLAELEAIETLVPLPLQHRITVAHTLRFSPRFSQLKRLLYAGQLGEIRHVYSRRNPSTSSVKRVLGKFSLAFWLSCHDIDLIRWFTESEVESVYAVSRANLKGEDDYLLAHLRLRNGIDVIHEVSWCSPPLSMNAPTCQMYLRGTKGMVEVNDSATDIDLYQTGDVYSGADTQEFFSIEGRSYGVFFNLIDRWITGIKAREPAYPSFADAAEAIRVCALIEEAVQSGKKVFR